MRVKMSNSYKNREERADLLLQNEQLRDEKESLLQKAINIKQNMKTLKAELAHRE